MEILVSVMIFAVGIIVIMSTFDACLSALSSSGDMMRATFLMRERISAIEQDGTGGVQGGRFAGADSEFSWKLEVRPAGRASGAVVNEVVVSVWRDTKEQAPYSLATYARESPRR